MQSGDERPATIINAVKTTSNTEFAIRTGLHVGLWLVVIAFQCIMGFNSKNFLDGCLLRTESAGDTAEDTAHANYTSDHATRIVHSDPSESTVNIGITGATFTLIGVALVLAVGGYVPNDQMRNMLGRLMPTLLFAIQFFTTFGTVSGFYIFSQAAQDPESCGGYTTSVFGVAFMLLAQLVLYSNIACINKHSLPRNLLPAAVLSVQIVSYFAIMSEDFAPRATDSQKLAALLSPISTAVAILVLMVLQMPGYGYSPLDDGTESKKQPLRRAFVLFVFTVTGMLSVYKLSFVASYPDSTSYLFALTDAVLTTLTLTLMFVATPGHEESE